MAILDVHPVVLIGLGLLVYMLPTVVASTRWHKNAGPIMLVNLFLGWTVLGWFVALIWSTTSHVDLEGQAAAEKKKRARGPVWQRISNTEPVDQYADLRAHLAAPDEPDVRVPNEAPAQQGSMVDQLAKLADLLERGHLTADEYASEKKRLLSSR